MKYLNQSTSNIKKSENIKKSSLVLTREELKSPGRRGENAT
jgi:hypothetical protein